MVMKKTKVSQEGPMHTYTNFAHICVRAHAHGSQKCEGSLRAWIHISAK